MAVVLDSSKGVKALEFVETVPCRICRVFIIEERVDRMDVDAIGGMYSSSPELDVSESDGLI